MEQKRSNWKDSYAQEVIQLCFDSNTLSKMSPGFKLVFAQDDPPVFVNIQSINLGTHSSRYVQGQGIRF